MWHGTVRVKTRWSVRLKKWARHPDQSKLRIQQDLGRNVLMQCYYLDFAHFFLWVTFLRIVLHLWLVKQDDWSNQIPETDIHPWGVCHCNLIHKNTLLLLLRSATCAYLLAVRIAPSTGEFSAWTAYLRRLVWDITDYGRHTWYIKVCPLWLHE